MAYARVLMLGGAFARSRLRRAASSVTECGTGRRDGISPTGLGAATVASSSRTPTLAATRVVVPAAIDEDEDDTARYGMVPDPVTKPVRCGAASGVEATAQAVIVAASKIRESLMADRSDRRASDVILHRPVLGRVNPVPPEGRRRNPRSR